MLRNIKPGGIIIIERREVRLGVIILILHMRNLRLRRQDTAKMPYL